MIDDKNEKNDDYPSLDSNKVACDYCSATNGNDILLQNNDAVCSEDGSALINFYRNSTIFITGGTGFVGKVLIEKLLRTCPHLSRIYILIRPKWNQTVEERFKNLLNSSVSAHTLFLIVKSMLQ